MFNNWYLLKLVGSKYIGGFLTRGLGVGSLGVIGYAVDCK